MTERFTEDLLGRIEKISAPALEDFGHPLRVDVGQIRRLDDVNQAGVSMMVAVLATDESLGTAQVVAAVSPPELASTRDIVVSAEHCGAPFPVVLLVDAVASVWMKQLIGTPQTGRLESSLVRVARRSHHMHANDLAREVNELGHQVGSTRMQPGDHLWWLQSRTIAVLASLAESCNEARLSTPIADPAILDAALTRGSLEDLGAVAVLRGLIQGGYVTPSPTAWDFLTNQEPLEHASPDLVRLLGDVLLDGLLQVDGPKDDDAHSEEGLSLERRRVGVDALALEGLLASRVSQGISGTRVFTSPHLWEPGDNYEPIFVGATAHAVVLETEESLEHGVGHRDVVS